MLSYDTEKMAELEEKEKKIRKVIDRMKEVLAVKNTFTEKYFVCLINKKFKCEFLNVNTLLEKIQGSISNLQEYIKHCEEKVAKYKESIEGYNREWKTLKKTLNAAESNCKNARIEDVSELDQKIKDLKSKEKDLEEQARESKIEMEKCAGNIINYKQELEKQKEELKNQNLNLEIIRKQIDSLYSSAKDFKTMGNVPSKVYNKMKEILDACVYEEIKNSINLDEIPYSSLKEVREGIDCKIK